MNTDFYLNKIFDEDTKPLLFLDFDGTISKKDVIDQILMRFADEKWLDIEDEWLAGKIGSRECLQKQFALVKATVSELDEFIDELELDDGFCDVVRFCNTANIKIHIVSDGFEYYIRRMLAKAVSDAAAIEKIEIYANLLKPGGTNQWTTNFPYFEKICADGCATCKPAVMRLKNPLKLPAIFIGDGLSDRFAAQDAHLVFAKKSLAEFCLNENLPHINYRNLKQVAENLRDAFERFSAQTARTNDRKQQAGIYLELNESFI